LWKDFEAERTQVMGKDKRFKKLKLELYKLKILLNQILYGHGTFGGILKHARTTLKDAKDSLESPTF